MLRREKGKLMKMRGWRVLIALGLVAGCLYGVRSVAAQQSAATSGTTPQLAILDTDIGDDIDDAFALGLVLRSPEIKLLGVTAPYGQTTLRARLLERYLKAVGREDVPIAAGPSGKQASKFRQAAYTMRVPNHAYPDAVSFLLDQIRAHPGEITLLGIGPFTNLKAAIDRDPVTFRKLKRVVLMGGSVYEGYEDHKTGERNRPPSIEWNIRCDPPAAKALFESGVPLYVMPLDSTQIHLSAEELRALLAHGSALTDQISLLFLQWTGVKEWRSPTLFDPVAIAYAIRPELCPTKSLRIEVDEKGYTRPVEGKPNAEVCLKADEAAFRSFLLERLKSDPAK